MPLSRVTLASVISILLVPTFASAGDWMMDRHRQPHHHHEQSVIGGNGLPSVVPGVGTFAGDLSAERIKGNGIFIHREGRSNGAALDYRAPKARIIEISAENPDGACAFEAGVCVIRPAN